MVTENRAPDLTGVARAWHLRLTPDAQRLHISEFGYPHTGISSWLINGPYHPLWSWWMLACISLRDYPGMPPANKQYPEAEYELAIYSLDTDRGQVPDVDALENGRPERGFKNFLLPADVTFHFHGITDSQAADLADEAARHIAAGQSCDSDFRGWWLNALAATVEHIKSGAHTASEK